MTFANAWLRFPTGLAISGKFDSSLFRSLVYLLHCVHNMRDIVRYTNQKILHIVIYCA